MKADQINIFYTDDDRDDIVFFKDAVVEASNDVNVIANYNGGDLLQLLTNPPPHPAMVFLDWNMPGKDGAYVLKQMMASEEIRDVPVIILSTSDLPENVAQARALGAKMYMTKPNSFKALVQLIKYALTIDWETFVPNDNNFFYNKRVIT
jgi:CheY-like chemotaxis protein